MFGPTLLENLTDDAIAQLYMTIFSTISLYLTKRYVIQSFAIASTVTYSEIRHTFITVYILLVPSTVQPILYIRGISLASNTWHIWNMTSIFLMITREYGNTYPSKIIRQTSSTKQTRSKTVKINPKNFEVVLTLIFFYLEPQKLHFKQQSTFTAL